MESTESMDELQATYKGMTDDELIAVASDAYDLTGEARTALGAEISRRGLRIELKNGAPQPAVPEPVTEDAANDDSGGGDELESGAQAAGGAEDGLEEDEYDIRCPKCHSDEVVFENRESGGRMVDPEAASEDAKYDWHCDACGYHWQDDGVEENSDHLPVSKG